MGEALRLEDKAEISLNKHERSVTMVDDLVDSLQQELMKSSESLTILHGSQERSNYGETYRHSRLPGECDKVTTITCQR